MTNKRKEITYFSMFLQVLFGCIYPDMCMMQIIVCLFMGGHEISIKSIFDFRTSLPINEILYIQYINGKRKKCHRIKSHKTSSKKKSQKKKSQYIFYQMLLFIRMKPNLKYIVMIKQKATISP
jgi:hypothetical protein